MKKDELHVSQDEWTYTCTKTSARAKVKRARTKAKRSLSKKLLAQELADCGADYIVGTHTHSIQPHTILQSADGRSVPCIYSDRKSVV